jgi:hypothetical protein
MNIDERFFISFILNNDLVSIKKMINDGFDPCFDNSDVFGIACENFRIEIIYYLIKETEIDVSAYTYYGIRMIIYKDFLLLLKNIIKFCERTGRKIDYREILNNSNNNNSCTSYLKSKLRNEKISFLINS